MIKASCRFCGTGCSVPGRHQGFACRRHQDPESRSTAASNCIALLLSKILYGQDWPDDAVFRKKNGNDKEGDLACLVMSLRRMVEVKWKAR